MAENTRGSRNKGTKAAKLKPDGAPTSVVSQREPGVSASPPAGDAVPAPGSMALPVQRPEPTEEQQSGRQQPVTRELPRGTGQRDRVEFRHTGTDGRQETWSFDGVDSVSKALCRAILSCGLVVALIVVAVICVLAHGSAVVRAICGLAGPAVGVLLWVLPQAQRWIKVKVAGRSAKRRNKDPAGAEGHG